MPPTLPDIDHCCSLNYLTNLGKLQQLELRWVGQLKNAQLTFLPHLVALTALDLGYCRCAAALILEALPPEFD